MTIVEALTSRRIPFQRRRGPEIAMRCPFCEGIGLTFNLNTQTGAGKCWHASCNYKSKHAAAAVIKQLKINATLDDGDTPAVAEPVELPEDFHRLTRVDDWLDRKAMRYLLDRGISKKQIRERGMGVSFVGKYSYRIVMPNRVDGVLRSLVARDFTGKRKPKYLNSKGEKWLWGFDPKAKSVVLAEGVFKALRLERAGFSAAALLGHDITDIQLKQIRESVCEELILFPDPDAVGRAGVVKIADTLMDGEAWGKTVKVVWPVTQAADDMLLADLRSITIRAYDWATRRKLLAY